MSIADQVADLERLIADTARKADAVWDDSPEQGRALFESAQRDKAFLDRIKAGDPEAIAQVEQWDNPAAAAEPSEEEPPTVTSFTYSNGRPGFATYSEDTPEGSLVAKRRIMEAARAAGYGIAPADADMAPLTAVTPARTRSDRRPREHRSGQTRTSRGSPDDPDLDPPVTRFQRALRHAKVLDWDETATLVDHLLIRLERWGR